ncbi:TniB family NTP-binding protein [Lysobacter soli]|uniref:TniB family NTP-binding protein n=1 Tax=Lysobacter soli TaxID=453783 RepID=UPI003CEC9FA4
MKYPHLDSRIESVADRPVAERVSYMLADRYVPYPKAEHVIAEVDWILKQEATQRPKCELIIAEPGLGKTMLLNEIGRRLGSRGAGELARQRPLVSISLAGVADLKVLFSRALRALDSPFSMNDKVTAMYEQTCLSLRSAGTKILQLDELHNLLLARSRVGEAMAVIRDLANLPVSLVCAGTIAAQICVSADEQLRDRFRCHHLRPWMESDETRNLLATLESRLPLRLPSDLTSKRTFQMIVRMSNGHPRTMVAAIREAGRDALQEGDERIDRKRLKHSLQRVLAEKFEAL